MKKSIFWSSIVISAIIFFVFGYFARKTPTCDKKAIAQQTKQEIEARLIKGRVIPPPRASIYSLSGVVQDVGNDYIIVQPLIRQDPFREIFPPSVKILVNKNTKIEKWIGMTQKEYNQKMKACQEAGNQTCRIDPFYKQNAQLSDIEKGYYIIRAQSDTNIKGINQFTAKSIGFNSENPYKSR